jgi:hypothetical protein
MAVSVRRGGPCREWKNTFVDDGGPLLDDIVDAN